MQRTTFSETTSKDISSKAITWKDVARETTTLQKAKTRTTTLKQTNSLGTTFQQTTQETLARATSSAFKSNTKLVS